MTRLLWLTDIHLNFLKAHKLDQFLNHLQTHTPDALLLGGDIAEAPDFPIYLQTIAARLGVPIYFVLGNHDFYRSSIQQVYAQTRVLMQENPHLIWLEELPQAVALAPQVGLVGHGGWGDARYGDPANMLILNDDLYIHDLIPLLHHPAQLRAHLNTLGDAAAAHLAAVLPAALAQYEQLFVLTHVPPFEAACRYKKGAAAAHSLPRFACKAVGDVLLAAMQAHPHRRMTVWCGHTHFAAQVDVLPNLRVIAANAAYHQPAIQQIIEL